VTQAEIVAILKAHINVREHDAMTPAIEEHRRRQPDGDKHYCTITGVDKAAAAIMARLT
jgi:hypothetical protein